MKRQGRQGDIYFDKVKKPDLSKLKRTNNTVIAYGEVTGHAHTIVSPSVDQMQIYEDTECALSQAGGIYVFSDEPVVAQHDTHGTMTSPPKKWIHIYRQREYDVTEKLRERKVAD
jgi:hypothetical protein